MKWETVAEALKLKISKLAPKERDELLVSLRSELIGTTTTNTSNAELRYVIYEKE